MSVLDSCTHLKKKVNLLSHISHLAVELQSYGGKNLDIWMDTVGIHPNLYTVGL